MKMIPIGRLAEVSRIEPLQRFIHSRKDYSGQVITRLDGHQTNWINNRKGKSIEVNHHNKGLFYLVRADEETPGLFRKSFNSELHIIIR